MLNSEGPCSDTLEDAANRVRVYARLLSDLLRAADTGSPLGLRAPEEEAERLSGQLTFWKARCREIAERYP